MNHHNHTRLLLTPSQPVFLRWKLLLKLLVLASLLSLWLCISYSTLLADSPPNLLSDIDWDEDSTTPGNQQTFASVEKLEAAFNNARRLEELQLNLAPDTLGSLSIPGGQTSWDALSDDEKALYLINAERMARAGSKAGVIGLPLQSMEAKLDTLAQSYADLLVVQNKSGHNADGTPFERLDKAFGNPVSNPSTACREFMARGENIAYFFTSGNTIVMAIERSVYNWIYDDASSNWGHREAALLQDRSLANPPGLPYGFKNNLNENAHEGFLGIGRASSPGYNPFNFAGMNFGEVVVMKIIDPSTNTGCSFASGEETATPTSEPSPTINPTEGETPTTESTLTPDETPTPELTTTLEPSPTAEASEEATPTPDATGEETPTAEPTSSEEPSPTPTDDVTGEETPTPVDTNEETPTAEPTSSEEPSPTPTVELTPTPTTEATDTPVTNDSQTPQPTTTKEATPQPTNTGDVSPTPTVVATSTPVTPIPTIPVQARIQIIEDAQPDSDQEFLYYGAFGSFTLVDQGDAKANTINYTVGTGAYSFSVVRTPGWVLAAIQCNQPDKVTFSLPNRSVTINAAIGDEIICTFVNQKRSKIEIFKYHDLNESGTFDEGEPGLPAWYYIIFDGSGTRFGNAMTNSEGKAIMANRPPGSYRLCEIPSKGWQSNTMVPVDPDLQLPCYTIPIEPGEDQSLQFGAIPTEPENGVNASGTRANVNAQQANVDVEWVVANHVTYLPMVRK